MTPSKKWNPSKKNLTANIFWKIYLKKKVGPPKKLFFGPSQFFLTKQKKMRKKYIGINVMVMVLLSSLVKRFSVSSKRDFNTRFGSAGKILWTFYNSSSNRLYMRVFRTRFRKRMKYWLTCSGVWRTVPGFVQV